MKLIVNPHKVEIDKEEAINEKEINISLCKFEFADEITDDYVKEAYFTYNGKSYKQIIVNNICTFPQEVLVKEGTVELGVVATYTDLISGDITRYNPSPVYFKTDLGSLREAQNSQPITPSEMEQYEQALQDGLSEVNAKLGDIEEALGEVDNLDIDASKVDNVTTVTITDKFGDTKTVQILDGVNGTDGRDGVDGKDGKDGIDGTNGVDGFSPVANVSKSNGVATITITDKVGTTTATISDGVNGTNGRDGVDGRDGVIQYTAGANITIDENNVISATGGDLSNYYTKTQIDGMGVSQYGMPMYYFANSSNYNSTDTISAWDANFTQIEKENLANIVMDAYRKGYLGFSLLFRTTQYRNGAFPIFTTSGELLQSKPNTVSLYANALVENRYTSGSERKFASSQISIVGSWSDDIYTVTRISFYNSVYDMLTLNNTHSYTPTTDYHPATKKYVDDAISSAITDALGGNY